MLRFVLNPVRTFEAQKLVLVAERLGPDVPDIVSEPSELAKDEAVAGMEVDESGDGEMGGVGAGGNGNDGGRESESQGEGEEEDGDGLFV